MQNGLQITEALKASTLDLHLMNTHLTYVKATWQTSLSLQSQIWTGHQLIFLPDPPRKEMKDLKEMQQHQ